MKKFLLVIIITFCVCSLFSQKNYTMKVNTNGQTFIFNTSSIDSVMLERTEEAIDYPSLLQLIQENTEEINANRDSINANTYRITTNIDCLRNHIDSINFNVDSVNTCLDSIKNKIDSLRYDMDSLSNYVDSIKVNFDSINWAYDSLGVEIDSINLSINEMALNLDSIKTDVVKMRINSDSIKVNANRIRVNEDNIKDNSNKIKQLSDHIGAETSTYISRKSSSVTSWVYGNDVYVSYNKPIEETSIIEKIQIKINWVNESHIGRSYEFIVGTIDQRIWLLPRITFKAEITAVQDGLIAIFELDKNIVINQGEIIAIKTNPIYEDGSFATNTDDVSSEYPLYMFYNLNSSGVLKEVDLSDFEVQVSSLSQVYALQSEVESLNARVEILEKEVSDKSYIVDEATGEKYVLKISNGQIIAHSINYKNILVIGHSFVAYGNAPEADWYLDDGENRGMAPSINAHQWTSLVGSSLGASVTIKSGVDFERNCTADYDFASNWDISEEYDVVLIFLGENIPQVTDSLSQSIEAAIKYIKNAVPKADIFIAGTWSYGEKYNAILKAAANTGIKFVDTASTNITLTNSSNRWEKGDYYLGREGEYYPMEVAYSHPNDMGHLSIANKFLQVMGHSAIQDIVHEIILNQTDGGIISTPNTKWVENGVVTIRTSAKSDYEIAELSVKTGQGEDIPVERRTNNYYNGSDAIYFTFIMPKENVSVTPLWKEKTIE